MYIIIILNIIHLISFLHFFFTILCFVYYYAHHNSLLLRELLFLNLQQELQNEKWNDVGTAMVTVSTTRKLGIQTGILGIQQEYWEYKQEYRNN